MSGKIYVSPNASTEKLQAVTDLFAEAIDAKIAPDATTRNGLNKVHQALTKALGEAGKVQPSIEDQEVGQGMADGPTVPGQGSDPEATKMEVDDDQATQAQDTLLEELLDEEDEDS